MHIENSPLEHGNAKKGALSSRAEIVAVLVRPGTNAFCSTKENGSMGAVNLKLFHRLCRLVSHYLRRVLAADFAHVLFRFLARQLPLRAGGADHPFQAATGYRRSLA